MKGLMALEREFCVAFKYLRDKINAVTHYPFTPEFFKSRRTTREKQVIKMMGTFSMTQRFFHNAKLFQMLHNSEQYYFIGIIINASISLKSTHRKKSIGPKKKLHQVQKTIYPKQIIYNRGLLKSQEEPILPLGSTILIEKF